MHVKLNLIILHLDILSATGSCLLDNHNFISRSLLTYDVNKELRDILLEYVEMRADWVKFSLIDVTYTEDSINLYYSCIIPSLLKNKKGEWTNLGEINDKENKRLVFQAGQRFSV